MSASVAAPRRAGRNSADVTTSVEAPSGNGTLRAAASFMRVTIRSTEYSGLIIFAGSFTGQGLRLRSKPDWCQALKNTNKNQRILARLEPPRRKNQKPARRLVRVVETFNERSNDSLGT